MPPLCQLAEEKALLTRPDHNGGKCDTVFSHFFDQRFEWPFFDPAVGNNKHMFQTGIGVAQSIISFMKRRQNHSTAGGVQPVKRTVDIETVGCALQWSRPASGPVKFHNPGAVAIA